MRPEQHEKKVDTHRSNRRPLVWQTRRLPLQRPATGKINLYFRIYTYFKLLQMKRKKKPSNSQSGDSSSEHGDSSSRK
ncbi:hypothetical protein [Parasitella parasitica]|uniref:Uncharacterized protein n=1 Tax=Parasitella parasitica TaxID=35722 RepID=A0A0B7NSU5_9FUNG|nr:hypothetical protein [Parasitella parasitica]